MSRTSSLFLHLGINKYWELSNFSHLKFSNKNFYLFYIDFIKSISIIFNNHNCLIIYKSLNVYKINKYLLTLYLYRLVKPFYDISRFNVKIFNKKSNKKYKKKYKRLLKKKRNNWYKSNWRSIKFFNLNLYYHKKKIIKINNFYYLKYFYNLKYNHKKKINYNFSLYKSLSFFIIYIKSKLFKLKWRKLNYRIFNLRYNLYSFYNKYNFKLNILSIFSLLPKFSIKFIKSKFFFLVKNIYFLDTFNILLFSYIFLVSDPISLYISNRINNFRRTHYPILFTLKKLIFFMNSSKIFDVFGFYLEIRGKLNNNRRKKLYLIGLGNYSNRRLYTNSSFSKSISYTRFGVFGIKVFIAK